MSFGKNKKFSFSNRHPEEQILASRITLEDKFENYLKWYYDNVIKKDNPEYYSDKDLEHLRFFIEKMAVWYELRYPNYEINRLMPCVRGEEKDVSDILFNTNFYANTLLPEDSDARQFDWAEFYNPKAFIDSLPKEEKRYLARPKYEDLVYLSPKNSVSHFHLTAKGRVEQAEAIDIFLDKEFSDADLEGMHIKNVLFILESHGFKVPEDSEIFQAISKYKTRVMAKDILLDMVLFRIMIRGGARIGPRRAFLFAKEFGRSLQTPIEYGIDLKDPGLNNLIDCYLMHGGNPEINCYINYFTNYIGMRPLTDYITNPEFDKDALYQRLVNALSSQIPEGEITRK